VKPQENKAKATKKEGKGPEGISEEKKAEQAAKKAAKEAQKNKNKEEKKKGEKGEPKISAKELRLIKKQEEAAAKDAAKDPNDPCAHKFGDAELNRS
jgi:hypothetical protein